MSNRDRSNRDTSNRDRSRERSGRSGSHSRERSTSVKGSIKEEHISRRIQEMQEGHKRKMKEREVRRVQLEQLMLKDCTFTPRLSKGTRELVEQATGMRVYTDQVERGPPSHPSHPSHSSLSSEYTSEREQVRMATMTRLYQDGQVRRCTFDYIP